MANDGTPNQLWLQNADGTFGDEALRRGCAVNRMGMVEAGMGVVATDIDQDGDIDLLMTHLGGQTNTLYVNDQGWFQDATARFHLAVPSAPYTGFGLAVADFDQDGHDDLYVGNGRVGRGEHLADEDPFAEPNQLFRGMPERRFRLVDPAGGTLPLLVETTRGLALGDVDQDGDMDLVLTNNDGPARLLINERGNGRHWLQIRLRDRFGGLAVGSRVAVDTRSGRRWGHVAPVGSYLSSNQATVHLGLGDETRVSEITVYWPDGSKQQFGAHQADAVLTLSQTVSSAAEGRPQGER